MQEPPCDSSGRACNLLIIKHYHQTSLIIKHRHQTSSSNITHHQTSLSSNITHHQTSSSNILQANVAGDGDDPAACTVLIIIIKHHSSSNSLQANVAGDGDDPAAWPLADLAAKMRQYCTQVASPPPPFALAPPSPSPRPRCGSTARRLPARPLPSPLLWGQARAGRESAGSVYRLGAGGWEGACAKEESMCDGPRLPTDFSAAPFFAAATSFCFARQLTELTPSHA